MSRITFAFAEAGYFCYINTLNMESSENKNKIGDLIVEGLKKAAAEIEELRLQATLGKAEARDAYEDLKKKFRHLVHEAKTKFDHLKSTDEGMKLVNAFEFLQVQLALGVAESREAFEEQEKKISHAIAELEASIRNNPKLHEASTALKMEIEKFKIKLELLALHYKLEKISVQYDFEQKKKEFMEKLEQLRTKIVKSGAAEKWSLFQDDVNQAYSNLKKLFT